MLKKRKTPRAAEEGGNPPHAQQEQTPMFCREGFQIHNLQTGEFKFCDCRTGVSTFLAGAGKHWKNYQVTENLIPEQYFW